MGIPEYQRTSVTISHINLADANKLLGLGLNIRTILLLSKSTYDLLVKEGEFLKNNRIINIQNGIITNFNLLSKLTWVLTNGQFKSSHREIVSKIIEKAQNENKTLINIVTEQETKIKERQKNSRK